MKKHLKSRTMNVFGQRRCGTTARRNGLIVWVVCMWLLVPVSSFGIDQTKPVFPLKLSATRRHLVDQRNVPFLIMGDSPQSLLVNLSTSDMDTYMADRQAKGFNSILVMALCDTYTGGFPNGHSYEDIPPFTVGSSPADYDLSTPNPAYFSKLDSLLRIAASHGLMVFLDPIETGGWLTTLQYNGATKAYNYGKFLGRRYKGAPNVVWESGNDFQSWNSNPNDNNLVYQVMAGIAAADPTHLQTIELNYLSSFSNQDTGMVGPVLTMDAAYTYYETYDEVLNAYNSSPKLPVFMTEANYEYENDLGELQGPTGVFVLREQEYWTMTSGASGQLYGNHYTWTLSGPNGDPNWWDYLDSPGALEIQYLVKFFNGVPWWKLVPDQHHYIVTAGYGDYDGGNVDLNVSNYVTTAWIPDGSLAVIYNPAGNALTVNLSAFSSPVQAYWYDPSNGVFSRIAGSPFPNSGSHVFSTAGPNHDGQSDWVLDLKAVAQPPKTLRLNRGLPARGRR